MLLKLYPMLIRNKGYPKNKTNKNKDSFIISVIPRKKMQTLSSIAQLTMLPNAMKQELQITLD